MSSIRVPAPPIGQHDRLSHRMMELDGLHLQVAEQGAGPLVVLLHGWPECVYGDGFYQIYFQGPGRADAELASDPETALRRIFVGFSADGQAGREPQPWVMPAGTSVLERLGEPQELPGWITRAEIAAYREECEPRSGDSPFTIGLNWYRNIDRNFDLLAPFRGRKITVPAMFLYGDRDVVVPMCGGEEALAAAVSASVERLYRVVKVDGCGHWTQQEKPDAVNTAPLDFLLHLDP